MRLSWRYNVIETRQAIDHFDEITDNRQVDAVFFGPSDISPVSRITRF